MGDMEKDAWKGVSTAFKEVGGYAVRVEASGTGGVPDVAFILDGISGWIELKRGTVTLSYLLSPGKSYCPFEKAVMRGGARKARARTRNTRPRVGAAGTTPLSLAIAPMRPLQGPWLLRWSRAGGSAFILARCVYQERRPPVWCALAYPRTGQPDLVAFWAGSPLDVRAILAALRGNAPLSPVPGLSFIFRSRPGFRTRPIYRAAE